VAAGPAPPAGQPWQVQGYLAGIVNGDGWLPSGQGKHYRLAAQGPAQLLTQSIGAHLRQGLFPGPAAGHAPQPGSRGKCRDTWQVSSMVMAGSRSVKGDTTAWLRRARHSSSPKASVRTCAKDPSPRRRRGMPPSRAAAASSPVPVHAMAIFPDRPQKAKQTIAESYMIRAATH